MPEKDRPVLAAAIRLRCNALVTGDRTRFGTGYGKVFGGVTVHSPRSLAEHMCRVLCLEIPAEANIFRGTMSDFIRANLAAFHERCPPAEKKAP